MRTRPIPALAARLARAALLVALPVFGCRCTEDKPPPPAAPTATATAAAIPVASTTAPVGPLNADGNPMPAAEVVAPAREVAGAAQVLVSYKGAEFAAKTVTRTKADAKKRAEEALGKIKKDKVAFEEVAKKYSDDAASKDLGGAIGNFERNAMPAAFSTATFDLKVGDISDVVETPRGFHIIKRTK